MSAGKRRGVRSGTSKRAVAKWEMESRGELAAEMPCTADLSARIPRCPAATGRDSSTRSSIGPTPVSHAGAQVGDALACWGRGTLTHLRYAPVLGMQRSRGATHRFRPGGYTISMEWLVSNEYRVLFVTGEPPKLLLGITEVLTFRQGSAGALVLKPAYLGAAYAQKRSSNRSGERSRRARMLFQAGKLRAKKLPNPGDRIRQGRGQVRYKQQANLWLDRDRDCGGSLLCTAGSGYVDGVGAGGGAVLSDGEVLGSATSG